MANQVERIMPKRCHVFKHTVALLPLRKSERCGVVAGETEVAVVLPNHDQARRIAVTQWAEQHRIGDAEDGGGRGNAKGQRRAGKQRECRTLSRLPQRVAHVLEQAVHKLFLTRTSAPPWDRP